jgi:hypothetical protein
MHGPSQGVHVTDSGPDDLGNLLLFGSFSQTVDGGGRVQALCGVRAQRVAARERSAVASA